MQFSMEQRRAANGVVIVALGGGMVAGHCEELEREVAALVAAGQKRVVLDMTGIIFMDSAGVGTIVACLTKLKKAGGDLRIAGAAGKAESVLKMTRVDSIIGIFSTAEAAAAGF